jgi:restriction system protein
MVHTPLFPLYSTTSELMRILDGESVVLFKNMWNAIWSLRGTPQNTVDWTNPDEWIKDRLSGQERAMAEKIWRKSNKKVNPRWTRGAQFLITNYELLEETNDTFMLGDRGKAFISSKDSTVARGIDVSEGLVQILLQLSTIVKGKRSDLLEGWKKYLEDHSNVKQESVAKDYLRARIVNLCDRKYIEREGNTYQITDAGVSYARSLSPKKIDDTISAITKLSRDVEKFNVAQRKRIRELLEKTTPSQFEHLIKDLLSAMEYEDIVVTSPTNDKGVDVTAISQHGITVVKEAIQVKRATTSNISRPILDKLRGSLHRFDAFQGTIITLSDFAKGAKDAAFEKGAAPITLINGEKLIDLLIQYELIVDKQQLTYVIVKDDYFKTQDESELE